MLGQKRPIGLSSISYTHFKCFRKGGTYLGGSFNTARRTIKGYEIMNMVRKGQIQGVARGAVQKRVKFINQILGVAA